MGRGAHRAVFAGGVDRGTGPVRGAQMLDGPAGDGEFGMLGGVAVLDPVAVGEHGRAGVVHQYRSEGFVTVVQRFAGQIDTFAQLIEVVLGDGHGGEFTPVPDRLSPHRSRVVPRPAGRRTTPEPRRRREPPPTPVVDR